MAVRWTTLYKYVPLKYVKTILDNHRLYLSDGTNFKERNLRILDFLPCILALPLNIGAISDMVEYGEYDYKFYGLYCARYVFLFAALLFAALGLRNGLTKEKQVSQLRGLQEKDTPRMQDVFGGSEALKTCKELLDMGIITQEEFDEKKRQILGL